MNNESTKKEILALQQLRKNLSSFENEGLKQELSIEITLEDIQAFAKVRRLLNQEISNLHALIEEKGE